MSRFNHIGLALVPSAVKKIIAKNADNKNPIQWIACVIFKNISDFLINYWSFNKFILGSLGTPYYYSLL